MNLRTRKSALFMIGVILLFSNFSIAWEDEGVQWWPAVGLSHQINPDWQFYFEQEERLGDDGGNMYYEHSDISLVYSGFGDWIDLGFNYRNIQQKNGDDNYTFENRPHFNVTFKGKICGLVVSDRSRIEYRDMENARDTWRYRNKIAVKFPVELTDLKLQPYIADDTFFPLDPADFTQNWFYTGFTFKLTENIKADIYHMWQATKSREEWKDVYVLGTKFVYSF